MSIAYWIDLILLVAGIIVLVIGYRRNHRNLMLIAAILLLLSGTLTDAATGFAAGFSESSGIGK